MDIGKDSPQTNAQCLLPWDRQTDAQNHGRFLSQPRADKYHEDAEPLAGPQLLNWGREQ